MMEGRTYLDGRELTREEFYRRLPGLSSPPTTAAPSPASFEAVYRKLIDQGYGRIFSLHISSKLSGMINAAAQAAKQFGNRVQIFDSGQVSLGLGFQVIEAGLAAAQGLSLEAVREYARQARERTQVVAMINTLEYLRRSGRVSWLRAGMGDLLKIKLLVRVRDGVVEPLNRIRTRQKALASGSAPVALRLRAPHRGCYNHHRRARGPRRRRARGAAGIVNLALFNLPLYS